MTITETIRAALVARIQAGTNIYEISRATGCRWESLRDFAAGSGGLRSEAMDRLAEYLGLEVGR